MKKITLTLMLFLSALFTCYSQVEIGSGTNVDQDVPYGLDYGYSYAQSIYLASEINASGTITSIQWYYNGSGPLLNSHLVIFLGHTTQSVFSSTTDWVTIGNLTKVYEGDIATTFPTYPGWVTIPLQTPFSYNGTDNLVVAVDDNKENYDNSSAAFHNTAVSTARSHSYKKDSTNPDPASPPVENYWGNILANFVPNIILEGITQSCPSPKLLTSNNITTTSAEISWKAPSNNPIGGIEIYKSTLNEPPVNNTNPTGHIDSGNSSIFSDLSPATTYYVWVRNNCGNSDLSSWSGPVIFTTECVAVPDFNENFDSATVPNLPNCWTKIIKGDLVDQYTLETANSQYDSVYSEPNSIHMGYSHGDPATNDIILVSPKLSTLATSGTEVNKYRLKFYALRGKYDLSDGNIQIGTLNNNTSLAVFTALQNITLTKTATEYVADFSGYTGTDIYIGIRMNSQNMSSDVYLDNIVWELSPSCPDITKLTVPEVTPDSATINWEFNDKPESWDVVIGEQNDTTPEGLTMYTADTNSKLITGLSDSKNYKVWVRAVCPDGDYGAWSNPKPFRTDCIAVETINENFDDTPVTELPSCWTSIVRGGWLSSDVFAHVQDYTPTQSPKNYLTLSNGYSGMNNDIILVSPNLSTLAGGTSYRLKFYARTDGGTSEYDSLEIGTVNSNTSLGKFTPIESMNINGPMRQYKVDFSSYIGTDTHIAFKMINNGPYTAINLDNIVWELAPSCPDVDKITIAATTTSGATIAWEKIGDENRTWEVAYGPVTETNPDLLTPFTDAIVPTAEISDLTDNTLYKVWVRSVCPNGDYGVWSEAVTFRTESLPVATFNENFDEVETPNLPIPWREILSGATVAGYMETESNPQMSSAPNHIVMGTGESNPDDYVILVSPELSTLSASNLGKYRLKFYAQKPGYIDLCEIEVGTLSSNTKNAVFTPVETVTATNGLEQYVIYFNEYNVNDTFIGIRLSSKSKSNMVHLDNIVWELAPLCPDVTSIIVPAVTTTSATIEWTKVGAEASWDIAYSQFTAVDPDPNTLPDIINSTEPTTVIPDLTDNTTYNVWVRSVCDTENGAWIGPVTFSTACLPASYLNENFDGVNNPNLPNCWNKIMRGDALSVNASVTTQDWGGVVSQPNCVGIYRDVSDNPFEIILVSPSLSTLTDSSFKLTFNVFGSGTIEVGTLNSISDTATFNLIKSFDSSYDKKQIITDLNSYSGTDIFIGFRVIPGFLTTIAIDDVVWEKSLSTNQFDLSQFNYYPNPVKDVLNISAVNNITAVNIYNLLGQEVIAKTINNNLAKVDMSALAKGTYMVKVTANNLVKTIKVIKQ